MSKNPRNSNIDQTPDEVPAPAAVPRLVSVAFHAGPPEIVFYKRAWRRGVPQPIPAEDWTAMQARGDFNEFNFKEAMP
jgi:hypothetical protein